MCVPCGTLLLVWEYNVAVPGCTTYFFPSCIYFLNVHLVVVHIKYIIEIILAEHREWNRSIFSWKNSYPVTPMWALDLLTHRHFKVSLWVCLKEKCLSRDKKRTATSFFRSAWRSAHLRVRENFEGRLENRDRSVWVGDNLISLSLSFLFFFLFFFLPHGIDDI